MVAGPSNELTAQPSAFENSGFTKLSLLQGRKGVSWLSILLLAIYLGYLFLLLHAAIRYAIHLPRMEGEGVKEGTEVYANGALPLARKYHR